MPNRENTDALSALTNRPTLPSSKASEYAHRRDRKCNRSPTPARKSAQAKLPISKNIGARRDDEEKMVATTMAFSQQIRAPETHRATSHGVITVASRGLGVTWEGESSRSSSIARIISKPTSELFRAISVGWRKISCAIQCMQFCSLLELMHSTLELTWQWHTNIE